MMELTERQTQLLKSIVEEYISTAQPVGSVNLVEKQGLNVSSATVRNEMARLLKAGFLEQPHTSAGRIPTTLCLRHYLNTIMQEVELPVLKEVAFKQRLWQERFEPDRMLRQAALALAEATGYLAFVTAGVGRLSSAGVANILDHPEFFDIDVTKAVLSLLDNDANFHSLLAKARVEAEVHALIGEELGEANLENCAVVFSPFKTSKLEGHVGVFGPARIDYAKIIPTVRYFRNLINEMGQGW